MADNFAYMNFNALDNIAGSEGLKSYHGTGAVTGKEYNALVVREDTVFTVLTIVDKNGATINELTAANLSGITLKAGEYIPAGLGAKITAFTISSGSVLAY